MTVGKNGEKAGTGQDLERTIEVFRPFVPSADAHEQAADLKKIIINNLSRSPVPLVTIIDLARRSDFPGQGLIEEAASAPCGSQVEVGSLSTAPASEQARYSGIDEIDTCFAYISGRLGEVRDGQIEMAHTVLDVFENSGTAFIEAATGTGKSLGYLVPSILHAAQAGARVMISTHTRNLQDQLLKGEMVLLKPLAGAELKVRRLMGRENYICARKLTSLVMKRGIDDPWGGLALALSAALCGEGIVESLPADAGLERSSQISAPSRCRMKGCDSGEFCQLVQARTRARSASIVFVNHALALTDYLQGGAILGPYQSIVFDEAHHLEDCVMDNLSVSVTTSDLDRIFDQLTPVSPSSERWKFLAGELSPGGDGAEWRDRIVGISSSYSRLDSMISRFFEEISEELGAGNRYRSIRTRYYDGRDAFGMSRDTISDILSNINELKELLKPFAAAKVTAAGQQLQQETGIAIDELNALGEELDFLVSASDEESVFWIEWSPAGKAVALCGSPLEVGRRFADFILESCESAIFTSATIAQNDSFDFIRERLGVRYFGREVKELVIDSPFDLESNCRIVLQTDLGDPNGNGFALEVAEEIALLARSTGAAIMTLLTSYRLCNAIAGHLGRMELPGPLFVQKGSGNRELLASRFKQSENPVLLGVASFWEGVDFPGEQLEMLIIPKLPFPVPTDPITEARSDRLKRFGENPFTSLHLPIAVLRLRQGIGRLIRRASDRGVVAILDSRMATRQYGGAISSSLPVEVLRSGSMHETARMASEWLVGMSRNGGSNT
ncbi:MAG: hypothetical protein KOO63_06885 [Bacteroidales bacterium]|nr:hypothetical protein [Candidatus Latescibacterota bacterium]